MFKPTTTKEKLKADLLQSAYTVLNKNGVSSIRMRNLAKSCNCAVGSIYNIFSTFEEIHFHLNLKTFKHLFKELYASLDDSFSQKLTPEETITKLGWVYIDFAKKHTNTWKALFEFAPENDPPKWYREEIDSYFRKAEKMIQKGFNIPEEKADRLINFFWFSIHGVCSIVLNKKATNRSDEFVESYVDHCIKGIYNLI